MLRNLLALLCLTIGGATPAQAPQTSDTGTPTGTLSNQRGGPPHAPARRLSAPPKIDGTIEPEEWKEAFFIEDLRDRVTGQPPQDRTEVRVGYDDRNLYFAFRCLDERPDRIVGREITPNAEFDGEDTVGVSINALGNRTFESSDFTTNILGTKQERLAGGRADKREWRGDWTVATSRDKEGWSAEMAIPWTMLQTSGRGKRSLGLNFFRFQFRTQIESSWANASQNPRPENDGYWDDIEPPAPPPARVQSLVYLAPEFDSGNLVLRAGLDARYPITPTLYGLASIAPDFRNIENFVAGVEFTRVERFVGDARPFFTEGSGFFSLNRGYSYGDLFYSRRVGEFDIGGKVYGQLAPQTSLGAFAAVKLDGQRAAVLNYARNFDSTASANAYATFDQQGPNVLEGSTPNRANAAFGASGSKRWGNASVSGGFSGESESGVGGDLAYALGGEYSAPNVFSAFKYYEVAPNFDPSLGYIPWRDRRGYYWYSELSRELRRGPIRSVYANFDTNRYRTFDGRIQQSGYSTYASLETRTDIEVGAGFERLTYFGALDEVASVNLTLNASNRFRRFGVSYQDGVRNDLPSTFTSLYGSYRLGSRLDLSVNQSVQQYEGSTSLSILTAGYQLSPTKAITGRAVLRDGQSNLYLAYRSAGGRGTDVFLILGDPNAPSTVARVSLKLVRAF